MSQMYKSLKKKAFSLRRRVARGNRHHHHIERTAECSNPGWGPIRDEPNPSQLTSNSLDKEMSSPILIESPEESWGRGVIGQSKSSCQGSCLSLQSRSLAGPRVSASSCSVDAPNTVETESGSQAKLLRAAVTHCHLPSGIRRRDGAGLAVG